VIDPLLAEKRPLQRSRCPRACPVHQAPGDYELDNPGNPQRK
jgi:hypothetical protein